ncbi:alpha/beta hydrolase [Flammeovirgaceae bacterium 311]|nr:alpha/beta hydrolase [Flammeovirgaceae bacterium 311]
MFPSSIKIIFRAIGALSVLICLTSCEIEEDDEIMFLRHKGADMPIWVRGNVESNVFVLFLHGGPGSTSYIEALSHSFRETEKQYAMVYWDQRASGVSQGKSSISLLTTDQFVEDLDLVIRLIEHKYKNASIFLLGHSWGGLLGTMYLTHHSPRPSIKGWIEVDGGHNLSQHAFQLSEEYVLEYANKILSEPLSSKDRKYWEGAINFYVQTSMWNTSNIVTHETYISKSKGKIYDPDLSFVGINEIFFSEGDFLAILKQNAQVVENLNIWGVDYTQRLHEIEIPTLVLWGKHDGILPLRLGIEAKEAYGLADDLFIVFENSAHNPHLEEPEYFNQVLLKFIKSVL